MDNEQKEYYIERVESYKDELSDFNMLIVGNIILIGASLLSLAVGILVGSHSLFEIVRTAGFTIPLAYLFFVKVGFNARIDEIKELFEYHGLNMDVEIAKCKGM